MAKKRKKKKGQLSFGFGINDERIPKLIGVLALFLSFYLFIAFTSYLFTWQIDQNEVLHFEWIKLLDSNLQMANWLGRLGAIVSNIFFYWGFGLPSYIIIYMLILSGFSLIRRVRLITYVSKLRYAFIGMVFLSIFFGFIGGNAEFPWGGTIGQGISGWLTKFVGTAGMVVLFLAMLVGYVVWIFNPNFEEMSARDLYGEIKDTVSARLGDRRAQRRTVRRRKSVAEDIADEEPIEELDEGALAGLPQPVPKDDLAAFKNKEEDDDSQLSINLEDIPIAKKVPQPLGTDFEVNNPNDGSEVQKSTSGPGPSPAPEPTLSVQMENKNHTEPYDPTLDLSTYDFPGAPLLIDYSDTKVEIDHKELEANKDQIIETLLNYKIEIVKIRATVGPTVTLYEIVPAPGVRISKIKNLEDDIALSLAALGIRIIAPIPGKGTIGIEVPNKKKQIVSIREVLDSEKFKRAKMDLPIALGKTISNEIVVVDLAKMPHLLVAGATGQGKSVGVNSILISLLYKKHPSQVKLVLIDPKKVELFLYSRLEHHFLATMPGEEEPIVTETNKVVHTLNSLCIEMDNRYDLLKKASARNIREYNEKFVQRRLNPEKGHRFLPFIVLVIDEFADLIMTAGKEVEMPIGRLAQLARAIGIHLIIATQRPSVNIITGVIKANFPARIAFKVTAKVDSRTILDAGGADQLIGRGDMLLSVGGEMKRIQGAFVDTPEVEQVIDYISQQQGYPEPYYLPEFHGDDEVHGTSGLKFGDLDEMFEEAARLIVQNQHGSTSMIQRRLKLGYNRAGRIMDQLEAFGIVGPSEGSKAREVLIYDEVELEKFLVDIKNK